MQESFQIIKVVPAEAKEAPAVAERNNSFNFNIFIIIFRMKYKYDAP